MGWCGRHVTSQSDASKDFHAQRDDCEGFVSAEGLTPEIKALLIKATRATRFAWLFALGVYVVVAAVIFLAPSEVDEKSFIAAGAFLIAIPVIRALTLVVVEAVVLTDADKRLIPKAQFLRESGILTEEDHHAARSA